MTTVPDAVVTAADVVELTRALVAVPSVSGEERALADLVERRLRERTGLAVHRVGDSVVARTDHDRPWRVLFAGHLDTVPGDGTDPDADPDVVRGLGAVDMKGGVAVMALLAEHTAAASHDCTFVFYDKEELGSSGSGMNVLLGAHHELVRADAAVVLEPSGGLIEAGCQGNLRVELGYRGVRAHTARPWQGVNAIHRAVPDLARMAAFRPGDVVVDGLTYRQSFSVVEVRAGVQGNVVPDHCVVRVNYRHAPTVDGDAAVSVVAGLAPGADESRVTLHSPAASPSLTHPLVAGLRAGAQLDVVAKLGWTDVGRLAAHGIPAVNFGPGDSELAHTPREFVTRSALEGCLTVLLDFLRRPVADDTAHRTEEKDGTHVHR